MACEDFPLSVLDCSSHLIVEVVRGKWYLVLWAACKRFKTGARRI